MLIAIDRNSFNYIFKYNSMTISISQILDLRNEILETEIQKTSSFIVSEFDRILPIFELDHEVLLLEIQKSELEINGKINLSFNSILKVYPLTGKAKNLLSGKLNQSIEINEAIFEGVIEKVKLIRSINNRKLLYNKLSKICLIPENPNHVFTQNVQSIVELLLKNQSAGNSYLANLIQYNYSPNEISSGNIEFLEKIGIITWITRTSSSEGYTTSHYFKLCEEFKSKINEGNYVAGFKAYLEIIEDKSLDFKNSHDKINKIINEEEIEIDLFKVSYYFLALKTKLNKNNSNLLELFEDLIRDIHTDPITMSHVLFLIAYSFSFEQLYESIHILEKSALLKSKFVFRDAQTIIKELDNQAKEEKRRLEEEEQLKAEEEEKRRKEEEEQLKVEEEERIRLLEEERLKTEAEVRNRLIEEEQLKAEAEERNRIEEEEQLKAEVEERNRIEEEEQLKAEAEERNRIEEEEEEQLKVEAEEKIRLEQEQQLKTEEEIELDAERIKMLIQSHTPVDDMESSDSNLSENKNEEIEIGKTIELDPFDNSEKVNVQDLKDSDDSTKNENEGSDHQETSTEVSEPSSEYQNSDNKAIDNNNEIEETELNKTAEIIDTSNEQKDDELNNMLKDSTITIEKSNKGNVSKTRVKKINKTIDKSGSPEITFSETDDSIVQNSEIIIEKSKDEESTTLTVEIFEPFLLEFLKSSYQNKEKVKLWNDLMSTYFNEPSMEITFDMIIAQTKLKPFFKDSMFESESEILEFREFFKNYNQ